MENIATNIGLVRDRRRFDEYIIAIHLLQHISDDVNIAHKYS